MATYIVDVIDDVDDGNTTAGHLSLREAIALANANPDADTITFSASLAGQTIVLTGELSLTEDVTIDGDVNGDHRADIAISGNDASRIFSISGGNTDVVLKSLTLTNGHAVAGEGDSDGHGGAILAWDAHTLTITDTTIKESTADSYGGGLRVYATDVSIANSLIVNNTSGKEGGGAFFTSSAVAMANTTVFYNTASESGGGISIWGPGSLDLANCDIVYNLADADGTDDWAGGGLYVLDSSGVAVNVANTLLAYNYSSALGFMNDVAGSLDSARNSAFSTPIFATVDENNINVTDPSILGIAFSLSDNGGTVQTLARGVFSILVDAGDTAALPMDVNDVDRDADTAEVLPLAGNGGPRVSGLAVDIGAVEYNKGSLFSTLDSLPLRDTSGSPIGADTLFDGDNETIVFVLPRTSYFDGTLDMFVAGEVTQANQLVAAAQAAERDLDVVMVLLDGYDQSLPGLSADVKLLHVGNPTSVASQAAVQAFYTAFDPNFDISNSSLSSYAFHRAPGDDALTPVRSIEPTGTWLGIAGQFQQRVVDTYLESALAATGDDVDLGTSLFPNLTTPLGAYDAVGEVIPNLTFVDQHGDAFSLRGFGEGLVVLSICAVWCAPCVAYAQDLDTLEAGASPVYRFVEVLVEDREFGLTDTAEAQQWATRFGLTSPVITPEGNVPLLLNFYRGIQLNAFPSYLVMDGATGKIVSRFEGYNPDEFLGDLNAVAEAYYKPVFSSGAAATVAENTPNTKVVYDADATDADMIGTIVYSLTGADAARFTINAATGQVRFKASPDFEAPKDAGADNKYDLVVRANDGVNIITRAVKITVTDAFEGKTTNGNDKISGTSADEIFRGGLGNDILTGKGGKDIFRFDTKLNAKTNVDHITDFTRGDDQIGLSKNVFKGTGNEGPLKKKYFEIGKKAKDGKDLISLRR